ncbi:gamma-cadinene synthase-like isoform X5 [Salvia miltiorrhiza]|uniref:gamma-cadinene synthase-like isoform X5 n=1 Tax=Salvia miltiorrhiza TaxID=226208 RepID=UPI0025ACB256|nr:gamma-cadinene synthase-like isoform X5 [Salvia miltiorrhiza]
MAAANMVTAISSNVRHIRPPIVTYKPNMWGHIFSTFSYDHQVQEKYSKEMEALKKEIRSMLMAAKSTKLMVLIDQIERLGLSYHFEIEIEEKLKQVYDAADDCDLFTTALRFRLLRQHQYHVSCTVFDKFVEKDCKWIGDRLRSDVEGILSLYEAAHVRIRDEKILDEALEFTVVELNHMLPTLESPTKEKVQQALKHSIHRSLPLLNIRFYISVYERDGTTNGLLLKLAKLNFNFLQNIYRKELAEIMRWWDKFDLKNKLPYARDRMVECYLWGNAFRYEPQYSYLRVVVAKNMQLATIMDDTYDNYGTLEEDDLFTDMLERWNLDEIDVLPEFMKVVYRFIMSVYEDYVGEAERQGKSFAVPYYRETRENREGKLPTVVDCYMKDKGVSKQETISEFVEIVENEWKDITAEWAKGSSFPKELVEQLLNYGRIAEITYNNKQDCYTDPEKYLGPLIAALYTDPLLI